MRRLSLLGPRMLVVCVVVALAAGLGVAGARIVMPQSGQDGWVYYHPPQLAHSHIFLVQEQRRDGSCVFSSSATISPGSPGVAEETVALNKVTCQARVERGDPLPGAETPPAAPRKP